MKTITIDFDLYHSENKKISRKGHTEGVEWCSILVLSYLDSKLPFYRWYVSDENYDTLDLFKFDWEKFLKILGRSHEWEYFMNERLITKIEE